MNEYQKLFIINCLKGIEQILSDNEKINNAVTVFTQKSAKGPRFQSSQISHAETWSDTDKVKVTAAIFEAIAAVTGQMCFDESRIRPINEATESFMRTIVPQITADTKPEDRLNSVKEHCARMSAQMNTSPAQNNSFSFFQAATIGGVVAVVAIAALALKGQ